MNKNEMIEFVSRKAQLSKKDCLSCLDAITELIGEVLKRGEEVKICGFGKFEPKIRQERVGINPQTMDKITIKQSIVASFKSSKELNEKLRY
jgi:DNA-binding protein HU-beta